MDYPAHWELGAALETRVHPGPAAESLGEPAVSCGWTSFPHEESDGLELTRRVVM